MVRWVGRAREKDNCGIFTSVSQAPTWLTLKSAGSLATFPVVSVDHARLRIDITGKCDPPTMLCCRLSEGFTRHEALWCVRWSFQSQLTNCNLSEKDTRCSITSTKIFSGELQHSVLAGAAFTLRGTSLQVMYAVGTANVGREWHADPHTQHGHLT